MTPDSDRPTGGNSSFQSRLFRNPVLTIGSAIGGLGLMVGFGAVVWQAIATRAQLWEVLLGLAIPAAICAVVIFVFVVPMVRQNRLLRSGRPAKAVIARVFDTGTTVNQHPQVRLELDVRRPDGTTYRAATTAVVSRLQAPFYQPGQTVEVRFDPKNPARVALVEMAAPEAAPSPAVPEIQSALLEIDAYNTRLLASGEPARATVVRADPMGVMVNGPNPAMKFLLKVRPVGAEPFLAEAAGVIGEQAVAKYQPGCEIHVRFESADKTRVGLDHS